MDKVLKGIGDGDNIIDSSCSNGCGSSVVAVVMIGWM